MASKPRCLACNDEFEIADPMYPGWFAACGCEDEPVEEEPPVKRREFYGRQALLF